MGIEYGPAHRALTSVQVGTGTDGQRFVLVRRAPQIHAIDFSAEHEVFSVAQRQSPGWQIIRAKPE